MKNTTTHKIPKKYHDRIDEVFRECADDTENDAYVIWLKKGWCCGSDYGVGTLIEYTQKDALERLRNTVRETL